MKEKPATVTRSEQITEHSAARYDLHLALRSALAQLRETSVLLRLQTANRTLANRRLRREIKRTLKARTA